MDSVRSPLLPQPGGFEGLAIETESAKGPLQAQVVFPAEEVSVAHPHALIEVSVQLDTALAPLSRDRDVDEDAIIAHGDQLLDHELVAVPRIPGRRAGNGRSPRCRGMAVP